jgi:hypothetical protein
MSPLRSLCSERTALSIFSARSRRYFDFTVSRSLPELMPILVNLAACLRNRLTSLRSFSRRASAASSASASAMRALLYGRAK